MTNAPSDQRRGTTTDTKNSRTKTFNPPDIMLIVGRLALSHLESKISANPAWPFNESALRSQAEIWLTVLAVGRISR